MTQENDFATSEPRPLVATSVKRKNPTSPPIISRYWFVWLLLIPIDPKGSILGEPQKYMLFFRLEIQILPEGWQKADIKNVFKYHYISAEKFLIRDP